jgi:flagellar biosynthesis protein FlhA
VLSIGDVQKVLQNLLKERLSIRDLTTIIESMADFGTVTKDPDLLSEYVRQSLARSICRSVQNDRSELIVFTVSPDLEQSIVKGLTHTEKGTYLILEPRMVEDIVHKVHTAVHGSVARARTIVLTSANVRLHLKRLTERILPNLVVLSHNEIPPNVKVISMGMIA